MLRLLRPVMATSALLGISMVGILQPALISASTLAAGSSHAVSGKGQAAAGPAGPLILNPLLKVTSVDGGTISAITAAGQPVSVLVVPSTTIREDGILVSFSAVQPEQLIGVRAVQPAGASTTIQAASITIVPDHTAGVITAMADSVLTVVGFDGAEQVITVDQNTIVLRAGQLHAIGDIAIGSAIDAEDTVVADGSRHAIRITIRLPHLAGTVRAVGQGSITIAGAYGAIYSIALTPDTNVRPAPGTANGDNPIMVGARIDAEGTLGAGGHTLVAQLVTVLPDQICPVAVDITGGVAPCLPPPPSSCPPDASGTIAPCVPPSACAPTRAGVSGCGPVPPAQLGDKTITLADNGQIIRVTPGQRLRVDLSASGPITWTFTVDNPAVLAPDTTPAATGTPTVFVARASGQATMRATGTPVCADNVPCTLLAVTFGVTVIVQ